MPRLDRMLTLASPIFGISIRVKIMGIVLGFLLMLGAGVTLEMRQTLSRTLDEDLERRAVSIGSDLAARSVDPILTNNAYALFELSRDVLVNNNDVRYVFILDSKGDVLVHTFGNAFPMELIGANPVGSAERFRSQLLQTEEGLIRDVAVPIFDGRAGVARVGLSFTHLEDTSRDVTKQLLITTGIVAAAGLLAAYFLTLVLTRPVLDLVEVARLVGQGRLDVRARLWFRDEIGLLSTVFNMMTEELKRKEEIRAKLLQQVITAQEEERKRIARELHDETGQALTSLMVGLKVIETATTREQIQARAAELRSQTADALGSIHDLALQLRPSALDDLGLVAAVRRYARDFGDKHGIDVDLQVTGFECARLTAEIETAIYRIVQEALSNVAKHAQASRVSVLLDRQESKVVAIVEDDGKGFDVDEVFVSETHSDRLGLFGMRERASLVGGTLDIESRPGSGTTVFVQVPVESMVIEEAK